VTHAEPPAVAARNRIVSQNCVMVPLDARELAARASSSDFYLPYPDLGLVHFGPEHPGELAGLYPLWLASLSGPLDRVLGSWTLVHRPCLEAIGSLGTKAVPDAEGAVEIGYELIAGHRGRGLATEAVAAFCEALLTGRVDAGAPVRRIDAETRADNLTSQAVLRRCGFTHQGNRADPGQGELLCWSLPG